MAYLIHRTRKDKKRAYHAQFYDPNRIPAKKTLTLRTTDKQVARQRLAQMERDYAMGVFDPWKDKTARDVLASVGVAEFERALKKEVQADAIGARHAESVVSTARLFVGWLIERKGPGIRLDRISAADVREFVESKKTANTRWQYHARLRRLFAWALETGAVQRSPAAEFVTELPPKLPPRYLTADEFDRLLTACAERLNEVNDRGGSPDDGAWWVPLFTFAVWTGLRNSELRFLRWQDVDLRDGVVRVVKSEVFTPKWGKGRVIPLLPEARAALTDGHPYPNADRSPGAWVWPSPHAGRRMSRGRKRTGQLNRESLASAFRQAADRAGLPEAMTMHSLRHTFASWMVQAGMPLPDIQRLMGHRNIATTTIYAHASDDSVRRHMEEAAERLRNLRSR